VATVPADTDSLSLLPAGHAGTQFIDCADDFVTRNAGVLDAGPLAFFREHVAVTDAAGLDPDSHVSCAWLGNLALDDLEITSRPRDLRQFHRGDCDLSSCHDFLREYDALSASTLFTSRRMKPVERRPVHQTKVSSTPSYRWRQHSTFVYWIALGSRASIDISRAGTQVNTGWTWHLEGVTFAEVTIELREAEVASRYQSLMDNSTRDGHL
jgi:hypothetical protein